MNPNISTNFFSREAMLKRQARTIRSRKLHQAMTKPLNIIVEEDESRSSSPVSDYAPSTSSGGSHTLGLKARRRHANVSDISISPDVPTHDDNDLSPLLLSYSRPTASSDSPDSFSLTFTDNVFNFPHPPTPSPTSAHSQDRTACTSPTHSINSLSSSPCSQHESMPLTPSSSDDESSFPSPTFNPRRAAIQPLVITKHNPRPHSPFSEISISPSLLQPFKNSSENLPGPPAITPLTSAFMDGDSEYESDPESDSEWYTKEFSQIISLYSPIPQSFPVQNSRPESMFISDDPENVTVATRPSTKRRVSRCLPPTSSSAASRRESSVLPVCQLDLVASTKRASRRISIPKYPPPPVPSMSPTHLQVPSQSTCSKVLPQSTRRPPPRSSIPADCDFDLELDEVEDGDDSSSAFSFSMYDIDLDNGLENVALEPESPRSCYSSQPSAYSQRSFVDDEEFGGVTFDLDYPMMLPLSLPTTPMDLEADIAIGLERLRNSEGAVQVEHSTSVVVEEQPQEQEQEQAPQHEQEVVDDIFSPTSSSFSFSPPPSATFYANSTSYFPLPDSPYMPNKRIPVNEEKILKSKWSSSTLASVREEHEREREQEHRRGASAKLRLYFGGQTSPGKRLSGKQQKVPPTPTSPFSLLSPRKASQARSPATSTSTSATASPSSHTHTRTASPSPSPNRVHSRGGSRTSNSDVMIIGYGAGVRRRGSCSTVSDVGSEDSSSSTSSSGLRRKPIPVEMFLRSAA